MILLLCILRRDVVSVITQNSLLIQNIQKLGGKASMVRVLTSSLANVDSRIKKGRGVIKQQKKRGALALAGFYEMVGLLRSRGDGLCTLFITSSCEKERLWQKGGNGLGMGVTEPDFAIVTCSSYFS